MSRKYLLDCSASGAIWDDDVEAPENGLFPPFLLIVRFGDFRKLVSNRSLPSSFYGHIVMVCNRRRNG